MAEAGSQRVTPVILSGGSGTRLWPLSRARRPKQMLALSGPESMLRATARRLSDSSLYDPIMIVAPEDQAEAVESEVERIGRLVLEPMPRNTAAAIALAALNAPAEELLLVLPSDHLVREPGAIDAAVRRALPVAQESWIVTFGMRPDRPETGYGYIKRGGALAGGVFAAERFVEKPDAALAEAMLAEGGFDWNGGIFLMRAGVIIDGLERHAPDVIAAARAAVDRQRIDGIRVRPDGSAFARAPAISVDYALMEKAEKVAVAPVAAGWSDLGSFAALYEAAAADADGNVLAGDAVTLDSRNCLIRSEGPLVTAVGVEDLAIVATADAVLVVPRKDSQRVKELVEKLKAEGREEWM